MTIALTPYAGEPELADPAMSGEWAGELVRVAGEGDGPWCTYLARRDGVAVGIGGFKGPPEGGAVEIGYLTFIPARGTGVARAVAAALVTLAGELGARHVVAHTLPETNASTRALAANGFARTAEIEDPEDGLVWRWERDAP